MRVTTLLRWAIGLSLAIAGAANCLSAQAKSPHGKIAATFLGQSFPAAVAGFHFSGTTDYESKQPGQGYSVRYELGPLQYADVYVYDLKRHDIPDLYSEKVSYAELASVGRDIAAVVKMGRYRSASPVGSFAVPTYGTPRLDCDRFLIVYPNGDERDSVACITNRAGKFVQIRLDNPRGKLKPEKVAAFLKAWVSP